jgi:hypothetical protein
MQELLSEASNLLQRNNQRAYEAAKSYWIGHIDIALGGGNYVDTHAQTFEKTLKEIGVEDPDEFDGSEPEED